MNLFTKLLTNNATLSVMDNQGYEYIYEGTHIGVGNATTEITFEIRIKYGHFEVYSRKEGIYMLDLNVQPQTYKVARIQGMNVHVWQTNYIKDTELRTYGIGGQLTLIPQFKGYVWSCIQNGQEEATNFATKKEYTKQLLKVNHKNFDSTQRTKSNETKKVTLEQRLDIKTYKSTKAATHKDQTDILIAIQKLWMEYSEELKFRRSGQPINLNDFFPRLPLPTEKDEVYHRIRYYDPNFFNLTDDDRFELYGLVR